MADDGTAAVDGARSRRKAMLPPAVLGVAHALLFLLSYWLLTSVPGPRAPEEEIAAFYQSGQSGQSGQGGRGGDQLHLVLAGAFVMPFAGIAFLWFSATLRARLRFGASDANDVVASVQFMSGVLYVALFFVAAAASSVMAVTVKFSQAAIDPVVARLFPEFGRTLLLGFAMRMAAMFVFTTSRLVRTTGALPRWFAAVGFVVGLFLLLSPTYSRVLVLLFPGWLVLLGVLLLIGRYADPADLSPPRAPP